MKWLGIVLLFICFCLGGCARPVEREAEKRISAVLPDFIGPAQKYAVRVQGDSAGAVIRGRFERVHIDGEQVQVDPLLTLDTLTLDFDEVAVDTRSKKLINIGKALFSCRIQDAQLNRYVRERRTDVAGLSIALRADTLFVSAKPDAFGLLEKPLGIDVPLRADVPINVEGKLLPRGDTRLDFQPTGARVSLVPIPQFALDYLATRVNPIVDLSAMAIPVQIQRAEVRGNYLYLAGKIRPDDLKRLSEGEIGRALAR